MRSIAAIIFVVFVASSVLAEPAAKPHPDGTSSYMMLTEGIVGGFVPAHVRRRIVVLRGDAGYDLFVMKQPKRGGEVSHLRGTITDEQFEKTTANLVKLGLWDLPVESPAGCQDIYQLDTSVAVRLGNRFWRNGGPAGCVHGTSSVQPNKEELATFRKIVALIGGVAGEYANRAGDAEEYNAVLRTVVRDASRKRP